MGISSRAVELLSLYCGEKSKKEKNNHQ